MKIKKSDIKLIVAALLVFCAIGAYYFCNMSLSEKTSALEAENASLQSEVDYLQDLMNHKQEYIEETEMMRTEIDDIIHQFPADVRPEDQIMYANDIELFGGLIVESVTMPGEEVVPIVVASQQTDVAQQDPAEPVNDAAEPVDAVADTTATPAPAGGAMASSIVLYRDPTTIELKSIYKSAKILIKSINESLTDKKSIESLSLSRDEQTGNLTGTLQVAMYYLEGADLEYAEPSVNGVIKGNTNIFNTSEDPNALWTTTTDLSGGTSEDEGDSNSKTDKKSDDDAEKNEDSKSE